MTKTTGSIAAVSYTHLQKSPDYTEFYRALAVLGCIFIVGVIATFIYTRMMVYIGQGVLKLSLIHI